MRRERVAARKGLIVLIVLGLGLAGCEVGEGGEIDDFGDLGDEDWESQAGSWVITGTLKRIENRETGLCLDANSRSVIMRPCSEAGWIRIYTNSMYKASIQFENGYCMSSNPDANANSVYIKHCVESENVADEWDELEHQSWYTISGGGGYFHLRNYGNAYGRAPTYDLTALTNRDAAYLSTYGGTIQHTHHWDVWDGWPGGGPIE